MQGDMGTGGRSEDAGDLGEEADAVDTEGDTAGDTGDGNNVRRPLCQAQGTRYSIGKRGIKR